MQNPPQNQEVSVEAGSGSSENIGGWTPLHKPKIRFGFDDAEGVNPDQLISFVNCEKQLTPRQADLQRNRMDGGMRMEISELQALRSYAPWRKKVKKFVEHKYFERVSLGLIVLNCLFLSIENPTADKSAIRNRIAFYGDAVLTYIFVVEVILKLVGLGFFIAPFGYFLDSWNWFDSGVIFISAGMTTAAMISSFDGGTLSSLRLFRVLRPLRLLSGSSILRIIVNSVIDSLPHLRDVMIMYTTILLLFAILAVILWEGDFAWRCVSLVNDTGSHANDYYPPNPEDTCIPLNNSWASWGHRCAFTERCERVQNSFFGKRGFDDSLMAMLTLFVSATFSGWYEVLYQSIDASSDFAAVFHTLFSLVASYYIINLSLVIINYAFMLNVETQRILAGEIEEASDTDKEEEETPQPQLVSPMDVSLGSMQAGEGGGGVVTSFSRSALSGNSNSCCYRFRKKMRAIGRSDGFQILIGVIICANIIALMLDYHGASESQVNVLEKLNIVFTAIFTVESVFKIVAFGSKFHKDGFNVFDLVVVILSWADIFLLQDVDSGVSVLRSFRLLRVVKLSSQFKALYIWITTMLKSIKDAGALTFLTFFFTFIYALLGMQLFGGKLCGVYGGEVNSSLPLESLTYDERCLGRPRHHFDSVFTALLTLFQVLTAEDWHVVMYEAMQGTTNWAALYFVSFFMIGNYVLLNLFIAVMLSNREQIMIQDDFFEEWKEEDDKNAVPDIPPNMKSVMSLFAKSARGKSASIVVEPLSGGEALTAAVSGEIEMHGSADEIPEADKTQVFSGQLEEENDGAINPLRHSNNASENANDGEEADNSKKRRGSGSVGNSTTQVFDEKSGGEASCFVNRNPFFCIPHDAVWIHNLRAIIKHPYFDVGISVLIFLSCVAIAIENPLEPPDHPTQRFLDILSIVFTVLFWIEALFKIFVLGFVFHPGAYLRDSWNQLDFFVCVVSLLSDTGLIGVRFLKVFRCLRPLRLISKSIGMKIIIQSLLAALPSIVYIGIILLLILVMFGIMGVQFFKGKFYMCTERVYGDQDQFFETKTLCLEAGYQWVTYGSNFDNFGNAFVAMWEMITFEGWVVLMDLGMDARSHEEAPRSHSQWWMAFYFVCFIIVCSFFVINFFMAVLMDMYDKQKRQFDQLTTTVKTEHLVWLELQSVGIIACRRMRTVKEVASWRMPVRKMFLSRYFDHCMLFVIVVNVGTLAVRHYGQSDTTSQVILFIDVVCTSLFAVEFFVGLVAMGFQGYVIDSHRKLDLIALVLCVIGYIPMVLGLNSIADPFWVVRVVRLFRVIRLFEGVRVLVTTLTLSVISILNVAALLLLHFFFFAVIGMNLFATVIDGEGINRHANFRGIYNSVLLLFRIANGEGWDSIRRNCAVSPPLCDTRLGNCGSEWMADIFFLLFMISGMYVMLNLFAAVIVSSFADANCTASRVLTPYYMTHFNNQWLARDPSCNGLIPTRAIEGLLASVEMPLGFSSTESGKTRRKLLNDLGTRVHEVVKYENEPLDEPHVHYVDLVPALIEIAFPSLIPELPTAMASDLRRQWTSSFPSKYDMEYVETRPIIVTIAAISLQRVWRAYLARKAEKNGQQQEQQQQEAGGAGGLKVNTTDYFGDAVGPVAGTPVAIGSDMRGSLLRAGTIVDRAGNVVAVGARVAASEASPSARTAAPKRRIMRESADEEKKQHHLRSPPLAVTAELSIIQLMEGDDCPANVELASSTSVRSVESTQRME